jgi:hypothetical protein
MFIFIITYFYHDTNGVKQHLTNKSFGNANDPNRRHKKK